MTRRSYAWWLLPLLSVLVARGASAQPTDGEATPTAPASPGMRDDTPAAPESPPPAGSKGSSVELAIALELPPPAVMADLRALDVQLHRSRRLRRTGGVLLGLGLSAFVAGSGGAAAVSSCYDDVCYGPELAVVSLAMMTAPVILVGTILVARGAGLRRIHARRTAASAQLDLGTGDAHRWLARSARRVRAAGLVLLSFGATALLAGGIVASGSYDPEFGVSISAIAAAPFLGVGAVLAARGGALRRGTRERALVAPAAGPHGAALAVIVPLGS